MRNMELSSNVFWHQTDYNGLRGIIKDKGLFYSYSREDLQAYKGRKIGFPMISLCDLPLSQFDDYIDKYGGYCIGLSHEWGVKNGFNPVWYNFMRTEGSLFQILLTQTKPTNEDTYNLLSTVKPYEGTLYRKDKAYENYRFYDEREIRRVPTYDQLIDNDLSPMLFGEEYDELKAARKAQGKKPYLDELGKIDLEYSDIKFIIVKEEHQIDKIYKDLENSFGLTTSNKEKSEIANKLHYVPILTYKQLKEDVIGCGHNIIADLKMDTILGRNFEGRMEYWINSLKEK